MWEGEKTNKERERTGMDISKKEKDRDSQEKEAGNFEPDTSKTIKFGKTFKRFTL